MCLRRRSSGGGSGRRVEEGAAVAVRVAGRVWARVAVGAAVIGILAAVFWQPESLIDFLYLIGSVFAPMIAIQIADYFLLKRDAGQCAFQWENLLVWLAGFVIYRLLMRVDIPVGNTLPDMLITMALCCVVARLVKPKN